MMMMMMMMLLSFTGCCSFFDDYDMRVFFCCCSFISVFFSAPQKPFCELERGITECVELDDKMLNLDLELNGRSC